jgi:type III polyketide synthase
LPAAADFDWALHPGGSTVITGIEETMKLTPEHLQASYEVYVEHGNSSSATIMSVMHTLRNTKSVRENVVACAFGPGISLELMVLKRPNMLDLLPGEDLD